MSNGDALLAAIIAAPDDDTPRLVYADWLDENGQPERAEFIRLQIENTGKPMAERQREAELLRRSRKLWNKPFQALFPGGVFTYSRGFVTALRTEWRFYQTSLPALLRMSPIEQIVIGKSYLGSLGAGNYLPYHSQPLHVRFCLALYQPDGQLNAGDVDILRPAPTEIEPFLSRGRWVIGCKQYRFWGWDLNQYPTLDYHNARKAGSRSRLASRPFNHPSEFHTWCTIDVPGEIGFWGGCWLVLEDGEVVGFQLDSAENVAAWLSAQLRV
jgi:uncharacterized protein (TIGR02996 family)